MKKNSIFIIVISILFLIFGLSLIIFCFPEQIPMHININNEITSLFSKWFALIGIAITLAFAAASIFSKQKEARQMNNALFYVCIFINLLAFSYFALEPEFIVGSLFKIPLSIVVYLPVSYLIIVFSNFLKSIPYKSKLGIRNKYTLETEFLWQQIHILAKEKFFAAGIILMLISLIFSFFNLQIIELILFVIILLITNISIKKESKMIYTKYQEMKTRKDNLQKNKDKK